jgi:dipeptidyl aminopeptidase/acylaminoacyl peptidase
VCGIHVDPERRGDDVRALDLQRAARDAGEPEIAWRLPYKSDGSGYTLASRLQLVLVDVADGHAQVATAGDFDVGGVAWSPDGTRIAFSRSREAPRETHCTDLWMLPVDARGPSGPAQDWRCQVSTAASPAWSPDGARVAFIGATNAGDAIMRLWVRDIADGHVHALGGDELEVAPGLLRWSDDGRRLAFVQSWRGLQRIAAIDVGSGEVAVIAQPPRGQVTAMAARGRIAYGEDGVDHPIELHATDWTGAPPRQLTDFNAWFRDRPALRLQRRGFEVPDGRGGQERIEGWLLLPPGGRGPMPLLVDVHGGPASIVKMQFATTPYWQILASRGWAVLMLDAVGSASYGREFSERLNAHWGELDLPQHLAAVAALRRERLADRRTAIAGASYGGFLSAWAIGTCDEFRAAVITAPVGNLESHFGTSDSGYYADPYSMEGKPEENRDLMLRLSPMAHIERACAPALLIQGKEDQRCPIGQSEELFVKLLRSGTPAELVLYPGGSHHLLGQGKPSHRLHAVRRIVDWLERWIDPAAGRA